MPYMRAAESLLRQAQRAVREQNEGMGLRRPSPVQRVYCRIGKAGSLEAPNAALSKLSSRPPPCSLTTDTSADIAQEFEKYVNIIQNVRTRTIILVTLDPREPGAYPDPDTAVKAALLPPAPQRRTVALGRP